METTGQHVVVLCVGCCCSSSKSRTGRAPVADKVTGTYVALRPPLPTEIFRFFNWFETATSVGEVSESDSRAHKIAALYGLGKQPLH